MMNGGIDGYDFCGDSSSHPSGNKIGDPGSDYDYEVNIKQGNTKEVDVALQFDPASDKGAMQVVNTMFCLRLQAQDGTTSVTTLFPYRLTGLQILYIYL